MPFYVSKKRDNLIRKFDAKRQNTTQTKSIQNHAQLNLPLLNQIKKSPFERQI